MNYLARRRAFSLIEMLVAMTISALLLAATLVALDASFKSYKVTTESASSHVVARMVMHRITTMIRTGEEFGPFPLNPLSDPVIIPDPPAIEFVSARDDETGEETVTRLERRNAEEGADAPYELWFVETRMLDGEPVEDSKEAPLLTNVQAIQFTLRYDVGPRLTRATVDLTIRPDDLKDAAVAAGLESPSLRLVSTIAPRRTID